MQTSFIIKINFPGGLISPGKLLHILKALKLAGLSHVCFGLRQQLFIECPNEDAQKLLDEINKTGIAFEINKEKHPNIVSSYPAEEIFITNTWLTEGIYKDVLDSFDYVPQLKVNISDARQTFTPLFTGNINWVATKKQHFWQLSIRFPKTNSIYHWKDWVYTNDIYKLSKKIELAILQNPTDYFVNNQIQGDILYDHIMASEKLITLPASDATELPSFNLPYYEGFNRYHDKYWLGIYRRDEKYGVNFLIDACKICLVTKVGQLCSTPWKTLIIKGIEEKDRGIWNKLLNKYQINVRHAANELNFQVEDNCKEGLRLKHYLVKHLNKDDIRSFGICIGIKTKRKTEVFSSILIRKKWLISFAGIGIFPLYDILFAHNLNPNERTGKVFSQNNPRILLPELLRRAIIYVYENNSDTHTLLQNQTIVNEQNHTKKVEEKFVYQCKSCFSVYDEVLGEPENNIAPNTAFHQLPENYCCVLCEADKANFIKKEEQELLNIIS